MTSPALVTVGVSVRGVVVVRVRIPRAGDPLHGAAVAVLCSGADPGVHRRSTLHGVTSDPASGLIARLTAAVERAEADARVALAETDALLAELRAYFRSCAPAMRAAIAAQATPLRARRDALAARRERSIGTSSATQQRRPESRASPARPTGEVLAQLGVVDLRPGQREVIDAALSGRDALVVMATGSGKSLCYQVPALALGGLTVVVSPLIALIRDQYERMIDAGAPVRMLSSNQTADESAHALAAVARGQVRVVFCAPERFTQRSFLQAMAGNRIDLFVVDEAHCLVEWGDNFRPEYARLAEWRDEIGARTTLALTATATPKVGAEIVRQLRLCNPLVLSTGFDRPNISFDVIALGGRGAVARKWEQLLQVLGGADAVPAIIYCGTRKETSELADGLVERGLRAAAYHAKLTPAERTAAQDAFMAGAIDVMCATNAFGMGVDKADVRTVLHWSLPRSLEGYYQEAGRGGRDGKPARAVLLAMNADRGRLIYFNKQALDITEVDGLLRRLRSRADARGHLEISLEDVGSSDGSRLALAAAQRVGAIDLPPWVGGFSEITVRDSQLSPSQRDEVDLILRAARDRNWNQYRDIVGFIDETGCRRAAIMRHFGDRGEPHAPLGRCCDRCDPLPDPTTGRRLPHRTPARATRPSPIAREPDELDDHQLRVFQGLRAWRRGRTDGKPAYTVCGDASLLEIALKTPRDRDELLAIRGIGPGFMTNHANDLLQTLAVLDTGPSSQAQD